MRSGPARSPSAFIVARSCARWPRDPSPSWSDSPTSSSSRLTRASKQSLNKPIVAVRARRCLPSRAWGKRSVMPQSKVVVATVDDDRRVRESVQSVLESAGYRAVSFESAETFLQSGALSSVTCVIADVRLPGMNGTELQRRIRLERLQLPVILITAHDDDDIRQQALRDGAVAFLVKPFDGGDLLEHVARATNDA